MSSDTEYLLASEASRQELVLLHGWGCNREIWRPLLARLRPWANVTLLDLPGCAPGTAQEVETSLAEVLEKVLETAPRRAVYIGWSLGGTLALELASRHAERVAAVITLCSNPHFLAETDWSGMDGTLFDGFQAAYAADPAAGLRRFASLQVAGSRRPRALLRQLAKLDRGEAGPALLSGLRWLSTIDHRALLPRLAQPQLHILAEHDGLVPGELMTSLAALLPPSPMARAQLLEGATHLAPLDSPGRLAASIEAFLAGADLLNAVSDTLEAPSKKDVSLSFSRAATSYDSVATLQRQVGKRLLSKLAKLPLEGVDTVLDLGCGTGYFRSDLAAHHPASTYIGLDLAAGMVEFARAHAGGDGRWMVGDAESLPLARASCDRVFSSLALQWCYRPEWFLAELARVLKPGGFCVFSTLGPDTLRELRASWAAVDKHQHVNRFLPAEELLAAADRVPGIELSLSAERHTMQYQRVGELLTELKSLGAHNMNRHRPAGLTSRKTLQGMLQAYESWRVDDRLPATYDVIFAEVRKL